MSTRETLMDMKRTIVSNAKGFAFIGMVFAGMEARESQQSMMI